MAFNTYFIPNGPGNLASLFPAIIWSNVEWYRITVNGGGGAIASSTRNYLTGECCDPPYRMRIHFLNFLGGVDAINFKILTDEFGATSDRYQRPAQMPWDFQRSRHGRNRYNVKANHTVTLECNDYPPEDNEWINELVASPRAWLEWNNPQNEIDEDPDYLPIIINDIKILDQNEAEPSTNRIQIEMTYSYDKFIIRN